MARFAGRKYRLGSLLQRANRKFGQEDKPLSMVAKTACQVSTVIQLFVVEWQMHVVDLKKTQETSVKEVIPIFYLH